MKTTPLISLAACAGLLLSGCQSNKKNFAASPTYKHGTSSVTPAKGKIAAKGKVPGKIHVVWAQNSPHLPVKWYVDGKDAGLVAGSKSVTREKHWVYFYNLQTHSAFPDKLPDAGKAIPVDLSSSSGNAEATIEVTASQSPPKPPFYNNVAVLAPYVSGAGATGQISTVWKTQANCNTGVTVQWWRTSQNNTVYVGTVESTATGLVRGQDYYVRFYDTDDQTFFPIPDLKVTLKPSPYERDAKVKVCVTP